MTMSRFCLLATSMKVAYPTSDTPPPPHHHHCYTYTMMKYTTYTMMTVCVCGGGGGVQERERKKDININVFICISGALNISPKRGVRKKKGGWGGGSIWLKLMAEVKDYRGCFLTYTGLTHTHTQSTHTI